MSSLAPTLQAFFTDHLIRQRRASPNTIAAYRDTFRLLFGYIHQTTGKTPAKLDLEDIDMSPGFDWHPPPHAQFGKATQHNREGNASGVM